MGRTGYRSIPARRREEGEQAAGIGPSPVTCVTTEQALWVCNVRETMWWDAQVPSDVPEAVGTGGLTSNDG